MRPPCEGQRDSNCRVTRASGQASSSNCGLVGAPLKPSSVPAAGQFDRCLTCGQIDAHVPRGPVQVKMRA